MRMLLPAPRRQAVSTDELQYTTLAANADTANRRHRIDTSERGAQCMMGFMLGSVPNLKPFRSTHFAYAKGQVRQISFRSSRCVPALIWPCRPFGTRLDPSIRP